MRITINIDATPEEFQELFVPSDRQHEFITVTYDAYVEALNRMVSKQVDPHSFTQLREES